MEDFADSSVYSMRKGTRVTQVIYSIGSFAAQACVVLKLERMPDQVTKLQTETGSPGRSGIFLFQNKNLSVNRTWLTPTKIKFELEAWLVV